MLVAVTGATGFIGRYVTEALTAAGHGVMALGRDQAAVDRLRAPSVQAFATDYSEGSLGGLLRGVDAIVHLAGRRMSRGEDPRRFWPFAEANLHATENLLYAARADSARHFILASSISVYSAGNSVPFKEEDAPRPINAYGLSKLYAEQLLELATRDTAVKATALRITAVYGFGEKVSQVLMRFASDARDKQRLTIKGTGRVGVDQVYVRDVARAVLACLDDGNPGGVFNIGAGRAFTVREMAETANAVFGNEGNLTIEGQPEEERQPYMDIGRAQRLLGWAPRHSLREGLEDFRRTWHNNSPTV
jgi:UDP-glucose 4-epimerase